jgi:hypothetical protein
LMRCAVSDPVTDAAAAGKIPWSRVPRWQALLAADPQGTRESLSVMQEGIVPPSCPVCGSTGYINVGAADSPDPVLRICDRCGLSSRPAPVFRRWRGQPVHMPDLNWTPGRADFVDGPAFVVDTDRPYITIHCGPPAPLPEPPRPQDILAAAGLAHLWIGDL